MYLRRWLRYEVPKFIVPNEHYLTDMPPPRMFNGAPGASRPKPNNRVELLG